jgi:hypothetical protein
VQTVDLYPDLRSADYEGNLRSEDLVNGSYLEQTCLLILDNLLEKKKLGKQ